MVTSSELPAGKPDPRAFTALCQQLGTTAGSVVFVGDDPVADVAGARGAGLQAVLLDRDQVGRAPDGVTSIRSLTELPATLNELNRDTGAGAGGCAPMTAPDSLEASCCDLRCRADHAMKSTSPAQVVFDCDGVLVDSEPLSIEVDRQMLAELGWELSLDEIIERFVGRSHEHFLQEVTAHLGHPPPPGWDETSTPRYRTAYTHGLQPVPGIVEALDRITLPSCVASSGTHDKMTFTLGLTGLLDRFEGRLFSATEVSRGKPAPDLFLHAAKDDGLGSVVVRGRRGQPLRCGRRPGRRHAGHRLRRRRDQSRAAHPPRGHRHPRHVATCRRPSPLGSKPGPDYVGDSARTSAARVRRAAHRTGMVSQ